jgi:signal transduction histidine kinase/ActR/RegA family two-component response regulator
VGADDDIRVPTGLAGELRGFIARGGSFSEIANAVAQALSAVGHRDGRAFPIVCAYRLSGGSIAPIAGGESFIELARRVVGPDDQRATARVHAFELADLPRSVTADEGIVQLFGLSAPASDRDVLIVLLFARGSIGIASKRALELFALRVQRALMQSDAGDDLPELDRSLAHVSILERMIASHEAYADELALEARQAQHARGEDEARLAKERESDLLANNERLRRTQRAIMNVIDDLREVRASLEERVKERTRRLTELLDERDAVLAQEQRARIEAERANRMKDEFISTVSHELRTPLTAIVGWAQLLRSDRLTPEKRAAGIEVIERNARAQVRLVEDLLDFGRIIQGKFRLAVGPVEVVRVVEAALESLRPAAEARDVRIQRTLDSHATIVGDGERLQQVVWNLVSNAIKFTPKGGRVHVMLRRASSYVELTVADTGEGIAPEFLGHVFEPFRQADGSITRRSGGLGLGLSIVHSLVELHGGTVNAASDGVGKGATFTVRIPVAPVRTSIPDSEPSSSSSAPPEFDRPASLDGVKALVVDDEEDTRELVAYVLEQCGVRVTLAGSSADAIARLDEQRFDVIVSDVGMPGEDGLALVRRLRARSTETGGRMPALALTAYSRSEDRAAAIRAGFDSHLAKPVDPSELTLTIAALVRNQR